MRQALPLVELNGAPTNRPSTARAASGDPVSPDVPGPSGEPPPIASPDLLRGFSAAYERMRASGKLTYEASVEVRALVELLVRKGVVTVEELKEVGAGTAEEIGEQFVEAGLGVLLTDDQGDKYGVPHEELPEIDCAERIPLCRAACCTLRFALTEQDVLEVVVQWDLTHPYANRQNDDGWCVHCDDGSRACGVYEQRPRVCRVYDCREDRRIWLDFEQRRINPDLFDAQGRVRRPLSTSGGDGSTADARLAGGRPVTG